VRVCQSGPFLKPSIPMESSEHPSHMPHVVLANQLDIQVLYSKESRKTAKTCNLCIGVARSHPCNDSDKAPHMRNIVSATFVHGGVVVETARGVFWEHYQQGVCNAQQLHSCCIPSHYSSSSICRHSFHSGLAPSDGRTAVFGEFLMYTSCSARSKFK
jgi:hypothetical protein